MHSATLAIQLTISTNYAFVCCGHRIRGHEVESNVMGSMADSRGQGGRGIDPRTSRVRIQDGVTHHSVLLPIAGRQIQVAAKDTEVGEDTKIERRPVKKEKRRQREKKRAADAAAKAELAAKRLVRNCSLTTASCLHALNNIRSDNNAPCTP